MMTLEEVQQMMENERINYCEAFNRRHPNRVYPICVICNQVCDCPYGNNAQPYAEGRCCSKCQGVVLKCRMGDILEERLPVD